MRGAPTSAFQATGCSRSITSQSTNIVRRVRCQGARVPVQPVKDDDDIYAFSYEPSLSHTDYVPWDVASVHLGHGPWFPSATALRTGAPHSRYTQDIIKHSRERRAVQLAGLRRSMINVVIRSLGSGGPKVARVRKWRTPGGRRVGEPRGCSRPGWWAEPGGGAGPPGSGAAAPPGRRCLPQGGRAYPGVGVPTPGGRHG